MIGNNLLADVQQNFTDQDIGDPATPCQGTTKIHDVRLLNENSADTARTRVGKASNATHRLAANIGHANRDEILDALRVSERGDILSWSLHTWFPLSEKDNPDPVASGIKAGYLLYESQSDYILTADLVNALNVGTQPAAMIMCGCASAQFIPNMISAGVAVAFGVARDPQRGNPSLQPFPNELNSMRAYDFVAAALMNNSTIEEAAAIGTTALNNVSLNQPCALIMDVRARAVVYMNKSLQDNKLL